MKRVLTVVLVVAFARMGAGEWTELKTIRHPIGNLMFHARWSSAVGLKLKVSPPGSEAAVTLDLQPRDPSVSVSPAGAFPEACVASAQFNPEAFPGSERESVAVVLKFRLTEWVVYVDERPVAILPAPFLPPAAVRRHADCVPRQEDDVRYQKVADFVFEDHFLVAEDEEIDLPAWDLVSGSWELHSAADSAVERGDIKADAPKRPDATHSPNFYSLTGKGTNAVATAGYYFYDTYAVEAAVRIVPGEMGLIFYYGGERGCFGFTARKRGHLPDVLLALWRSSSGTLTNRTVIEAVRTAVTSGQWVHLRVVTSQNRVQCFMDNVKMIDTPVELPPGGRFGLYADAPAGTRFDDVRARTNRDLDLRNMSGVRRHTILEDGSFFPRRGVLSIFRPRGPATRMTVPAERRERRLILGSTAHAGHVFAARFLPRRREYDIGLVGGYKGEESAHYRFTCSGSATGTVCRLYSVQTNRADLLESIDLPSPAEGSQDKSMRLMLDATGERELRLYRDDELVLVHHPADPLEGASGIYIGSETAADVFESEYTFERAGLHHNEFEKNRAFVHDPFMRHWSSPEGEWIALPGDLVWYKGDLLGRFELMVPYVAGSQVHLGVPEGETNGTYVMRAEEKDVLLTGGATNAAVLARVDVSDLQSAVVLEPAPGGSDGEQKRVSLRRLTLHSEGRWIWLMNEGKLLFKCALPAPLPGRRARVSGFSTAQLRYTRVLRYSTKDYLFAESPHEWVMNGGKWEIVNRFQCQPRWSHMNGESRDNLAAMWTKYLYGGDFCVEMYAGPRHGWYVRAGDLNMTVMNSTTSPGDGYTITCTGWDPDHSQLHTRLHRNGKILAESDKYLVPRNREDKKRHGYNPLVAAGRDLHGAWYYMKLRRIGRRLEYFFDNELVFAVEDEDPIPHGSMGIWTFMNSMVVARVKIAAERIEPRPIGFVPVPPHEFAVAPEQEEPQPAAEPVLNRGTPLGVAPSLWTADDSVGRLWVTWHEEQGMGPYFAAENVLGSGSMLARCSADPVPASDLAGWRFRIKRTPGARFNFHYSVGTVSGKGKYTPKRFLFHRISGTDFSQGKFGMTGDTPVADIPPGEEPWHRRGEWALVEVWRPTLLQNAGTRDSPMWLKVEGFGNRQPSDVLQGLAGNRPGDGYAVRDFSEIRCAPPELTQTVSVAEARVRVEGEGGFAQDFGSIHELGERLKGLEREGKVVARLTTGSAGRVRVDELCWVNLPDRPRLGCRWSEGIPGAIEIVGDEGYLDPRLAHVRAAANGHATTLSPLGADGLLAVLPRISGLCATATGTLNVAVSVAGADSQEFELPWNESPVAERPVLVAMDGMTPFIENFETQLAGLPLSIDRRVVTGDGTRAGKQERMGRNKRRAPMRVKRYVNLRRTKSPIQPGLSVGLYDEMQGRHLEVANGGKPGRLRAGFTVPVSIAQYPLLRFRYRGEGMVNVSLSLAQSGIVKLSEDVSSARRVRYGKDLVLDGRWHSWFGLVSDVFGLQGLGRRPFSVSRLQFGSVSPVDQTGIFSKWQLDDLTLGPAVSEPEHLAFTPTFFSFFGIDSVSACVKSGPANYEELSEDERVALAWNTVRNAEAWVPDIGGVPDGVCHVFVKARDRAGRESRVTDVPFFLDREPIRVEGKLDPDTGSMSNESTLRIKFVTGGGAPLDVPSLKVKWHGEEADFDAGGQFVHEEGSDTVLMRWARTFKRQLNSATNGQEIKIGLTGIRDCAGNESEDVAIPVRIDYAQDRSGPVIQSLKFPSNVLWCSGWQAETGTGAHFGAPQGEISVVRTTGSEAYLEVKARGAQGHVTLSMARRKWLLTEYPYLAFRIRQPAWGPGSKSGVDMAFAFPEKEEVVVPLTRLVSAKGEAELPELIAWDSNSWHSVAVDLRSLLGDKIGRARMSALPVQYLQFRRTGTKVGESLHLQSAYIYSDWEPSGLVEIDAYDASGTDGVLASRGEVESGRMTFAPASLQGDEAAPGWMSLRVRDRAGNLSLPVRIPPAGAKGRSPRGPAPVELDLTGMGIDE